MDLEMSPFVKRWLSKQSLNGKHVLDYAAGSGRHGRFALGRGAKVTFIDKNISNLQDLTSCSDAVIWQADLEDLSAWPLVGSEFDIVIVSNYLFRARMREIFDLTKANGLFIYQTFAWENGQFGRPRNPDYLLRSCELKQLLPSDFHICAFETGYVQTPNEAHIQRLAAIRKA